MAGSDKSLPGQLAEIYRQACEIELLAFKPGNVSIYSAGHDMSVEDFRLSYRVSAPAIASPDYSLGEKIYHAVRLTREAVGCNTNLGIILLCAPLLQAVLVGNCQLPLRARVREVLRTTTVEDANWTFRAIALASPGGLGEAEDQDVHDVPDVTLTEAMRMAADKDRIALQYISDYKDIFDLAVLRYNNALYQWGYKNWAAVAVYVLLLRRFPDSHIERKFGKKYTRMVEARMAKVDQELSRADRPVHLIDRLHQIDAEFKSAGLNPGTTADMTVATVLVSSLERLNS